MGNNPVFSYIIVVLCCTIFNYCILCYILYGSFVLLLTNPHILTFTEGQWCVAQVYLIMGHIVQAFTLHQPLLLLLLLVFFFLVVVVVNAEMWQKEKETKKNQVIVQLFLYLLLQTTTTNTSTIEVSLIYSVRYISRHYLRQSRYKLHFYY